MSFTILMRVGMSFTILMLIITAFEVPFTQAGVIYAQVRTNFAFFMPIIEQPGVIPTPVMVILGQV